MRKQILIVDSDDRQIRRIAGVVKETAVQSGNRMEIYVANTLVNLYTSFFNLLCLFPGFIHNLKYL